MLSKSHYRTRVNRIFHFGSSTLEHVTDIQAAIDERFAELSKLTEDWDSYGGRPMSPWAHEAMLGVLKYLQPALSASPSLSLTPEGGVLASWGRGAQGLDIRVEAELGFAVSVYACAPGLEHEATYYALSLAPEVVEAVAEQLSKDLIIAMIQDTAEQVG